MSSSVHANNKVSNILVLGRDLIQGISDTTIYAEKTYLINFTKSRVRFCLSLLYNGDNSYVFVNGTEICKFKAKKYETKDCQTEICLGNISRDFSVDNMKKQDYMEMFGILVLTLLRLQSMTYQTFISI